MRRLAGFRFASAAAVLLLSALTACSARLPPTAEAVTFVVVRHAEKRSDDADDPALTAAGAARAARLTQSLRAEPLVAVYATGYRRTRETAQPAADAHGLAVTTYDARAPAHELAARWKQVHSRGTVLVVGHSNTAPAIAAALCACEVAAMDEREYDRRMTVIVAADGSARLQVSNSDR